MPGIKIIEFSQGDVRLRDVPILVVSGIDTYREQILALGVDYFLVKPLPLQDLLSVVDTILGE